MIVIVVAIAVVIAIIIGFLITTSYVLQLLVVL